MATAFDARLWNQMMDHANSRDLDHLSEFERKSRHYEQLWSVGQQMLAESYLPTVLSAYPLHREASPQVAGAVFHVVSHSAPFSKNAPAKMFEAVLKTHLTRVVTLPRNGTPENAFAHKIGDTLGVPVTTDVLVLPSDPRVLQGVDRPPQELRGHFLYSEYTGLRGSYTFSEAPDEQIISFLAAQYSVPLDEVVDIVLKFEDIKERAKQHGDMRNYRHMIGRSVTALIQAAKLESARNIARMPLSPGEQALVLVPMDLSPAFSPMYLQNSLVTEERQV